MSVSDRRVLYMAHPVGGDVAGNVRRALGWLAWLMACEPDVAFIAPWLACIAAGADDSNPRARERGMLDNLATVVRCDGIVLVGGRISIGMQRELNVAVQRELDIDDLTDLGVTAPPKPIASVLSRAGVLALVESMRSKKVARSKNARRK